MEKKISVEKHLDLGTMILYYLPEDLKTYIGYIRMRKYVPYYMRNDGKDLHYLVSGGNSVESRSIVPDQILGYVCSDVWISTDTYLPTSIFDIIENFNHRFGIPDHKDSIDSLRYAYIGVKDENGEYKRYKNYYNIPTFDLSASYIRNHKNDYYTVSTPSPSEQLKKKLKRIEVNGEYMTAVWYDCPATVIKLSDYDMYDTEKAYMWLLLKGLCCDNNKSECDRVLKLMEDITFEKK